MNDLVIDLNGFGIQPVFFQGGTTSSSLTSRAQWLLIFISILYISTFEASGFVSLLLPQPKSLVSGTR
jgi:hypothetical protein